MKKRTMLKAMNALVKASAKENRWNTGFEYIPARKPVSGSYMRHAMHVARIHQSNDGWIPVVWTPDGMTCGVIRESSFFRGRTIISGLSSGAWTHARTMCMSTMTARTITKMITRNNSTAAQTGGCFYIFESFRKI